MASFGLPPQTAAHSLTPCIYLPLLLLPLMGQVGDGDGGHMHDVRLRCALSRPRRRLRADAHSDATNVSLLMIEPRHFSRQAGCLGRRTAPPQQRRAHHFHQDVRATPAGTGGGGDGGLADSLPHTCTRCHIPQPLRQAGGGRHGLGGRNVFPTRYLAHCGPATALHCHTTAAHLLPGAPLCSTHILLPPPSHHLCSLLQKVAEGTGHGAGRLPPTYCTRRVSHRTTCPAYVPRTPPHTAIPLYLPFGCQRHFARLHHHTLTTYGLPAYLPLSDRYHLHLRVGGIFRGRSTYRGPLRALRHHRTPLRRCYHTPH